MSGLPRWVEGWCRSVLGASPVAVLFLSSHLSEVVGVRLADGREVVVKRRVDESGRAGRCVAAQKLLAEQGFPCPMPLTDVVVSEGVAVHAERFVSGGEVETKDTPEVAARSGRLLADLMHRLAALDLDPPLPNPEWVRWNAVPEREAAAAAVPTWIEDATRRVQAKLARCDLPPVLGHADWQAPNIRWRHGKAHAVHDWDSLAWLPEAAFAGAAAGRFAIRDTPTLAPLESSEAFLDAYESERGAPFTPCETEIAWAASIWEALHNAHDELSYERLRAERTRLGRAG